MSTRQELTIDITKLNNTISAIIEAGQEWYEVKGSNIVPVDKAGLAAKLTMILVRSGEVKIINDNDNDNNTNQKQDCKPSDS
jgi:hypothetical protein